MHELKNFAKLLLGFRLYRKLSKLVRVRKPVASYGAKRIMDIQEGNQLIHSLILRQTPCAIGKIGASELRAINEVIRASQNQNGRIRESIIKEAHIGPGVFPPTHQMLSRFYAYFTNIAQYIDIIAVWFSHGEQDFIERFSPTATLIELSALDPFYSTSPWTKALAGKTVLVVSPFAETIVRQYQRRRLIWPQSPYLLPEFELQVFRLPLSDALVKSPYEDWLKAVEALQFEIRSRHFDVALIGGGAFSLPLVVAAKKMGKIGIHLGGSTQVLFGIRGSRWDTHAKISAFYNDDWVRPSAQETPSGYRKVDAGAYW